MTHVLAELFFVLVGSVALWIIGGGLRQAIGLLVDQPRVADARFVVRRRQPSFRLGRQSRVRRVRRICDIDARAA